MLEFSIGDRDFARLGNYPSELLLGLLLSGVVAAGLDIAQFVSESVIDDVGLH
jgi:hypothetical protein